VLKRHGQFAGGRLSPKDGRERACYQAVSNRVSAVGDEINDSLEHTGGSGEEDFPLETEKAAFPIRKAFLLARISLATKSKRQSWWLG